MKTYKIIWFVIFSVLATGCSIKPEPINYGQDGCYYCKMTIVDKIHGAEVVTNKGKIYKFDAAECMINYLADTNSAEIKLFLTNHHESPESLIDATSATYLISENLPSPMGAFLTAFKNKEQAAKLQQELGGKLYDWESVTQHIQSKSYAPN